MSITNKLFQIIREEGTTSPIRKSFIYLLRRMVNVYPIGYIRALVAANRLRKIVDDLTKIDNIGANINLVFKFNHLGISIKPTQIPEEIKKLLEIVKEIKPKAVLEIGTARGGTLFLFCQVADHNATLISIDLPNGYPPWKTKLYKLFAKNQQDVYLVKNDSHDLKTLNLVKKILNGRKLDFLFIDGDHTYEGVKMDFEMYAPLVRKGGIVAFHDIVPDYYTRYGTKTFSYTGGVPKFWNEIKQNYKYLEIINDPNQDGYGIGVFFI